MIYLIRFLEHYENAPIELDKKATRDPAKALDAKSDWEALSPMFREAIIEEVEEL